MEAAFGKAPLISRKGKNTDALGRFACQRKGDPV